MEIIMLTRRNALCLLAGGVAASFMPTGLLAANRKLVLEDFFSGRTTGRGRFVSGIANVDRGLRIETFGRWDGKVLTLREDFYYDDGERDQKTWQFIKLVEGKYIGRREDVIADANVLQDGNDITLAYISEVPLEDGSTKLRFEDRLFYNPDGSVQNVATVSKFGFTVGKVDIVFRKH
jgi:hypothetical protein